MNEYRLPTDTNEITLQQLQHLMDTIPEKLYQFSEEEMAEKPAHDKWSKKEIIGHLIVSATNNHQRFIRGQFEENPSISYNQVLWNVHGHFQEMDTDHLIAFWEMYNRHLIELISRVPRSLLEKTCQMSDGTSYTLSWLFDDYVRHLEHHLKQIVESKINQKE